MKAEKKLQVSRRRFFKTLGVGAAAVAVAPVAGEAAAAGENRDERKKARYQANAPEVQTYYRVNRYPAKKS
jgi:hypothetical protein